MPNFLGFFIFYSKKMFLIRKEFEFDTAHRLIQHTWKCFNVHWHRYKVIVELKWELNEEWMIEDFSNLKRIKERLDKNWDHAYIYNSNDEVWNYLTEKWFQTYCMWDIEPTAENMAKFLFDSFSVLEPRISSITVYETPTASAIYPVK